MSISRIIECPRCLIKVQATQLSETSFVTDEARGAVEIWEVLRCLNEECAGLILVRHEYDRLSKGERTLLGTYPPEPTRPIPPVEVTEPFRSDYIEACAVFASSPKASAAMSRRCLQNLLREKAKVKHSSLNSEIDELLASANLPSHLAEAIDAIRNLGNFAAHPIKSTSTGVIVEVEPGEAEWLLDVLDGLFDFYLVQPAVLAQKRNALNKKLQEAGKPLMK